MKKIVYLWFGNRQKINNIKLFVKDSAKALDSESVDCANHNNYTIEIVWEIVPNYIPLCDGNVKRFIHRCSIQFWNVCSCLMYEGDMDDKNDDFASRKRFYFVFHRYCISQRSLTVGYNQRSIHIGQIVSALFNRIIWLSGIVQIWDQFSYYYYYSDTLAQWDLLMNSTGIIAI